MKKQFLVALHAESNHQVLAEAKKILAINSVDGVVIVNNGGFLRSTVEYPNLFDTTIAVKDLFPNKIIGINPLELSFTRAINTVGNVHLRYWEIGIHSKEKLFDFLWTDGSGINEKQGSPYFDPSVSDAIHTARINENIPHYVSVAFKYQSQPKNLEAVAKFAAKNFAKVVTSGDGTGIPANIGKIKNISSFVGVGKLVLASGVTVANIHQYAPYVGTFIVGTSLLIDPKNNFLYDQKKIDDLGAKITSL